MEYFANNQKIRITDKATELFGRTGKVVRVLIRDSSEAWIKMDKDLPEKKRSFPKNDERKNNICLFADQCELIT